jgi:hypothetical protein
MKLSLSTVLVALFACALGCGCGAGTQASQSPAVPGASMGANSAAETPGTTQLMFAEVPRPASPAPKVGKAHLVLGEDLDARDATSTSTSAAGVDSDELRAPKEARRSDGSRRGGHFGATK